MKMCCGDHVIKLVLSQYNKTNIQVKVSPKCFGPKELDTSERFSVSQHNQTSRLGVKLYGWRATFGNISIFTADPEQHDTPSIRAYDEYTRHKISQ